MILYTKLVLQAMRDQGTLVDMESELENLPDGLDAACVTKITTVNMSPSYALC